MQWEMGFLVLWNLESYGVIGARVTQGTFPGLWDRRSGDSAPLLWGSVTLNKVPGASYLNPSLQFCEMEVWSVFSTGLKGSNKIMDL